VCNWWHPYSVIEHPLIARQLRNNNELQLINVIIILQPTTLPHFLHILHEENPTKYNHCQKYIRSRLVSREKRVSKRKKYNEYRTSLQIIY